ncbi:MAG: DNA polymerase III subunit alpha [Parcubacteria group bacterium]|nr:DNA polymerase III subunit alpha [Parcubacteria group bacterium]
MSELKFTHLHTHSHYSLLDGMSKIGELISHVKKLGMNSVAITDHGNLYGAIEFYQKAKKAGIKPIIGCEMYITEDMHSRQTTNDKRDYFHLILLVKNETGYKNLVKLVTASHLEGFYYKPRIDKNLLRQYSEGLIALSGCLGGEVSRAILSNQYERAKKIALEYREIFGLENYYLEVQQHLNTPDQNIVTPQIIQLSKETKIPLVATQDSHYLKKEDINAHDVLLAVQTGTAVDDKDRLTMKDDDYSLASPEEMTEKFKEWPEALENTLKIAQACNLELTLGEFIFPEFVLEPNKTADQMLDELTLEGAKKYDLDKNQEAEKRRHYELEIIKNKKYAPYFLVVADLIRFARESRIYTTVRGSAAGSLVAFLSGITNVNPIEFQLPFERFLNPFRPSAPDIDMDFADNRRQEVIEYTKKKYGTDKVAQIGTFGTMMAKGAVRDVARAMGKTYELGDKIAKLIPFGSQGFPMSIKHAMEVAPDLKNLYDQDLEVRRIIDTAQKLEGTVRHVSVHAAGVVIAPKPLTEYVPIQFDPKGSNSFITQYDMYTVGEDGVGLTKLDFLGIRNLAILENAVSLVRENRNVDIDIEKIPLDDKKTFSMLSRGETEGLFQLNGSGMTKHLMDLKPTTIHDINAMVALYRPGPMNNIPEYIARKQGRQPIKYFHPKAEKFLSKSYGILVYQDDLLFTAMELAGYSWETVDKFRKAVGKKIPAEMAKQHEIFVKGCQTHSGMTENEAEQIWKLFEPFQGYGFNKCLTGDTEIYDYNNGNLVKIEEIYNGKKKVRHVLSLGNNMRLEPAKVKSAFDNGTKEVFEVRTRSGRKIKATSNHPFLGIEGWSNLENLAVGDKIAVPRIIKTTKIASGIPDFKLAVLGYLLAEGNLCHPAGFYFYSKQKDELNDYIKNLEMFANTKAVLNTNKPATSVYSKRIKLNKPSEAVLYIESLGLKYKKATEKFIPDFIFNLPTEKIAVLIGKMFQGDGCINIKGKDPQVFYATSSKKLTRQLQHLLLRFGILSTIHAKKFKYRDGIKLGFTLNISRWDNLEKFIQNFSPYFVGDKKKNCEYLPKNHPILNGSLKKWAARGSSDSIPINLIRNLLRKAIIAENYTYKSFAETAGISERLLLRDNRKIGYLRETIQKMAEVLNNEEISKISHSDILWDEIKEIKSVGLEKTYDLEIEGTHNFVANDFIVHNSHAACYGRVAYQTAYMKANFPIDYMCAVLRAEAGNIERIAEIIDECQRMKIEVLPPDINESFDNFSIPSLQEQKIRFGLLAIKNVGENLIKSIIEQRTSNGEFKSIEDLVNRIQNKDLNKKSLESLIRCGALDQLGERNQLLANVDQLLNYGRETQKNSSGGQISLFGANEEVPLPSIRLVSAEPASKNERLTWEKELLGLFISDHPVKDYQLKLQLDFGTTDIRLATQRQGSNVKIGGLLTKLQRITTRTGQLMLFGWLEDLTSKVELVIFPKVIEKNPAVWQENKIIVVRGRVNEKDGIPKIICDEATLVASLI